MALDLCAIGVGLGLCAAGGALYLFILDPARPRNAQERAFIEAARRTRGVWRSARQPLGPSLTLKRSGVEIELVPLQPHGTRLTLRFPTLEEPPHPTTLLPNARVQTSPGLLILEAPPTPPHLSIFASTLASPVEVKVAPASNPTARVALNTTS